MVAVESHGGVYNEQLQDNNHIWAHLEQLSVKLVQQPQPIMVHHKLHDLGFFLTTQ